MLSKSENEKLCRIGPGTAMGEVFRRFWNPVLMSSELLEPECEPVRLEMLGEQLVAFRDSKGQIGVIEEMCMHRGASLALGRVEDGAIRCLYHGWKFAMDGSVLEMPNVSGKCVRSKLKATAYPAREAGGLIWIYMGPANKMPPFPDWAFMHLPLENLRVSRFDTEVNYMQQLEGGTDTSHVGILHTNDARPGWMSNTFSANEDLDNPASLASDDLAPELELEQTEFGFRYASTRRIRGQETVRNVRIVPIAMPSTRVIPSPMLQFVIFEVPMNDMKTTTLGVSYDPEGGPIDAWKLDEIGGRHDPMLFDHATHRYIGTWENRFGQDRKEMAKSWSGIKGVVAEDQAIAVSQGPIVDRSKEHLVAADMALVRARKQLLESAERIRNGGDPIGVAADFSKVMACDRNIESGVEWKSLLPL